MNCKESLLQSAGSCCSLDSLIEFPAVILLVLSPDMQTMSACYALDRKKGKTENELLLDSLLFQLALLKGSPLPGSAGEKHISTVCDYAIFSTLNIVCAGFIFVGCETLLSGVQHNAERNVGYYA